MGCQTEYSEARGMMVRRREYPAAPADAAGIGSGLEVDRRLAAMAVDFHRVGWRDEERADSDCVSDLLQDHGRVHQCRGMLSK